jgi:hypothetical protein
MNLLAEAFNGMLASVTGAKQHFLPAAVIGGFGRRATGERLRDAEVVWRRREWDHPQSTKARYIGYVNGMYRLADPPDGVSPDIVDELWDHIEQPVPNAIAQVAARAETEVECSALLDYAAAASVRHPNFAEWVNRRRSELGMSPVTGDEVHVDRVELLRRGLDQVAGFRWRFLHAPVTGPHFVLNDRGWSYVGQQDRDGRGLWIPLNSKVGMLAWLQRGVAGGFEHLNMWPGWATWLNTATWQDAPSFVVGRPEDCYLLDGLTHIEDVAPRLERLGPYRDRRIQGLFSDFL